MENSLQDLWSQVESETTSWGLLLQDHRQSTEKSCQETEAIFAIAKRVTRARHKIFQPLDFRLLTALI